MDDHDLVADLATRATTVLPPRPSFLPAVRLNSSFVGELQNADVNQILTLYCIATMAPEAAGEAPAIRMAIRRLPSGAAVVIGAIDDASDSVAEWAPFDQARGLAMLAGLRCRPGLDGRDVEALAAAVSNLSWFAHEAPFCATLEAERVAVMEKDKGCVVVAAKARFGPV